MTFRQFSLLSTVALVLGGCSRDTTPQPPQTPAVAPSDTAHPAVAVAPAVVDSPAAPPAPPKPARKKPAVPDPRPAAATPAPSDSSSASAPLRDAYHTAPLDTVDDKTYAGWKYYNLNCARCHGEDVLGTTIAPHLIVSLKPDGPIPNEGVFLTTVCSGRPDKGMPAWCTIGLSPAQIDTIYSYVKGRSDAKIHPGRPARR
jgi:mono/diheme cytochrome c family protein